MERGVKPCYQANMKTRPFRAVRVQEAIEALASLSSARGLSILDGDGSAPHGERSYLAWDPLSVREAKSAAEARELLEELFDGRSESEFPRDIGFFAFGAFDEGEVTHPQGLPRARFARYRALLQLDEARRDAPATATLIGEDEDALDELQKTLEEAFESSGGARDESLGAIKGQVSGLEEEPPELHLEAIREAIARIERGELAQINLARRYRARFEGDPLSFYLAMRDASPVPFGFFQAFDNAAILGRSMENFLTLDARARRLTSSPIKGTRASAAETSRAPLGEDPRELGEHRLVLEHALKELREASGDMNARASSPYHIERFAALEHMISHLEAILPGDRPLSERLTQMLPALFPPLSVLGIPRGAAMRAIEELERSPRGVYCGAYGYVSGRGDCQLAVAIRTAFFDGVRLHYHAGGGLIAEANPEAELEETRLKARAFLDAIARFGG